VSAKILDGKAIAQQIKQEVAREVEQLRGRGIRPGLAVILVGNHPASELYVRNKVKTCESLGIHSEKITPPESVTTQELLDLVAGLNARSDVDGILVQLPLPGQVDSKRVLLAVDPGKDVDGFHPINVGNLVTQRPGLVPCTPAGILEILKRSGIPRQGARAAVLGRSDIVGKPTALLLLHEHATVTLCHSRTRDLAAVAREADILVAAMGRAEMVTADYVKPGATVIDVGMNRVGEKWVGDVHFSSVREVAGAITPVPGGVGPLTIAMLMSNTVKACRLRRVPGQLATDNW
jgi:methylenetetrahydrofolate dehydrogenase (NADP+)/methenyltetrahydrofolate cyclohydrolase